MDCCRKCEGNQGVLAKGLKRLLGRLDLVIHNRTEVVTAERIQVLRGEGIEVVAKIVTEIKKRGWTIIANRKVWM